MMDNNTLVDVWIDNQIIATVRAGQLRLTRQGAVNYEAVDVELSIVDLHYVTFN